MSKLNVAKVADLTGNGPVTLTGQNAAKVWCLYTTRTATSIRGSFNVSSLTDNGAGHTTISYTNTMASANYANVSSSSNWHTHHGFPSASSAVVVTGDSFHSKKDTGAVSFNTHGELA